jgi:hypothetical protein
MQNMGTMLHNFVQVAIVHHFTAGGAAIEVTLLVRGQFLLIFSTHTVGLFH